MGKYRKILVFLALAAFGLTGWKGYENRTTATLQDSDLLLGIGGHPLNAVAYNANSMTHPGVDYDTQVGMLKEMGLSIYRIDVFTNAEGKSINHKKFVDILRKCRTNGIRVLPMIYDRCRYSGTPEEAYREGFRQMSGFARIYGAYLDVFELGNEIELFDDLRIKGTGQSSDDYNMDRLVVAEQYIRGMEEGLKSVLPEARSMVNTAGYFPVYWMDRVFSAAPTIDICAWHIYAEMPGVYKSQLGIENIHTYLFERYKRPIWYTETNARPRENLTFSENEERALNWNRSFLAICESYPFVEAVIFHELLDNPERGGLKKINFEEENFGYVSFNGYPGKRDTAAYQRWRSIPDRYKKWSYKRPARGLISKKEAMDKY